MKTRSSTSETDVLQMPEAGYGWVVVHTRPRAEKKVADQCERSRIPVYVPLRKKVHRYGARERAFWSPLFSGYAFCLVDPSQKTAVSQSQHVANILNVLDQDKLVRQLRQIQKALDVGDMLEVMPYLEKGRRVRVGGGAFKGLEGLVLRVKGKTRVVVNVDMIRQSVAVEVDSSLLVPA